MDIPNAQVKASLYETGRRRHIGITDEACLLHRQKNLLFEKAMKIKKHRPQCDGIGREGPSV